jgi:hypothetical protein
VLRTRVGESRFAKCGGCLAAAVVGLSLLSAGADVAQARGRPRFDRVVLPTGDFPADVQNVQAAVDQGGVVLLGARNSAGLPTSFNFGLPGPDEVVGYQVALQGDVQLLGESVGSARTTIRGGYRPILVGVTGWGGEVSAVSGRARIQGIDFEGPDQSAIDVYKASEVAIVDNRISNVVGSFGLATGINVFGGGEERRITGKVIVRRNVIRYGAADLGWSHAIVLDDVSADVDVAHNAIDTTQEFSGILVVRQVEGTVRIARNLVVANAGEPGSAGTGIYVYQNDAWDDVRSTNPRYEIVGNRVVGDAYGIGLVGQRGSIEAPLVERNHVTARGSFAEAEGILLGGNVSRARVSRNRIDGAGAYGIDVFAFEPGQVAESNTFVGNDLDHFDAAVADLFLDAYTVDHTAVVGSADTVIDLGTGNRIVRRSLHR